MHIAVQPRTSYQPVSLHCLQTQCCSVHCHEGAAAWTATKVRSLRGILLYPGTSSWPPMVSIFSPRPQIASSWGKPTHLLTSHQLLPCWPFPTWLWYTPSLLNSPKFPSYSRNFWKQRIEMRSWELHITQLLVQATEPLLIPTWKIITCGRAEAISRLIDAVQHWAVTTE